MFNRSCGMRQLCGLDRHGCATGAIPDVSISRTDRFHQRRTGDKTVALGENWAFAPPGEQFTPVTLQFVPDSFHFDPFRLKIDTLR
jgi:hypothetical protein